MARIGAVDEASVGRLSGSKVEVREVSGGRRG